MVIGPVLATLLLGTTSPLELPPEYPDATPVEIGANPILSPITAGGNRVFNSSFELGLAGWALVCNTVYDEGKDGRLPRVTVDEKNPVHGGQCLKIDMLGSRRRATLNAHDVFGVDGKKLAVSFWIKAQRPEKRVKACLNGVSFDLKGFKDKWYEGAGYFSVTTEWTRVSFTTGKALDGTSRGGALKIDLPKDNVYWIDAVKVEVGDQVTDYAPMADVESANVLAETVVAQERPTDYPMEFRAVDYRTGEHLREQRTFRAERYGVMSVGGEWRGRPTLPEWCTVVHPLGESPLRMRPENPGFFLGVNGGVGRGSVSGGGVWMIGAHGVETTTDMVKYLRLGGNAMLRTQNIGQQWVDFEFTRGTFNFSYLDRIILGAAERGVETMFVLGGSAFMAWDDPKKDGRRRDWYVRRGSREARVHSMARWGATSRIPSNADWIEHLTGIYNHYKGTVTWYEAINEPNLQLGDPRDYAGILKLSYQTLKNLDPTLKVVGICATGDFGGQIGKYVDGVGAEGGFDHLDFVSFHPYDAAVDYTPKDASAQLESIRKLCEKYRPGVPRIQDEIYFLGCNHGRRGSVETWNVPDGNVVRRAALDLAAGCRASISLLSRGYLMGDACHPRHPYRHTFNFRHTFGGVFAAQNFCAKMLEGVREAKMLAPGEGLNGVEAKRPDGSCVSVIWTRALRDRRAWTLPDEAKAYDLYGNPLKGPVLDVGENPLYVVCPAECPVVRNDKALGVNPYDYVVFTPKMPQNEKLCDPEQVGDRYNDHFQVIYDRMRKTYFAFWTQATKEAETDMHVVFSKSSDLKAGWSEPRILAGSPTRAHRRATACWQQPMLAKSGRLYCLWNQQLGEGRCHFGIMKGIYSDDAGETWSEPAVVPWPKDVFRHAKEPDKPPHWCIWQRPLRLGPEGTFFAGVSHRASRVGFISYPNIDENPDVADIRTEFMHATEGTYLTVPRGIGGSCCEEASIVRLPDGRLFALLRSRTGYPLWTQSRDQGRSWDPLKVLVKANGEKFLHCCSPCPMYDVKGCEAGSGRYFALIHNVYDFAKPSNRQNRGPLYLIAGEFDPVGEQPVAFGEPKLFAPRKSGNSFYASYTVDENGEGILWFNDMKYWLLGRRIRLE